MAGPAAGATLGHPASIQSSSTSLNDTSRCPARHRLAVWRWQSHQGFQVRLGLTLVRTALDLAPGAVGEADYAIHRCLASFHRTTACGATPRPPRREAPRSQRPCVSDPKGYAEGGYVEWKRLRALTRNSS